MGSCLADKDKKGSSISVNNKLVKSMEEGGWWHASTNFLKSIKQATLKYTENTNSKHSLTQRVLSLVSEHKDRLGYGQRREQKKHLSKAY